MAYRMVYLRVRSSGYSFGWTSDTDQAAFKDESRRIFQELGWALHAGHNGVCDTVTKGNQDGWKFSMFARNGATVLPGESQILRQIDAAPNDAPDLIVFDGYTNDAYGSKENDPFNKAGEKPDVTARYGVIQGYGAAVFDQNTFCGTFEALLDAMRQKWPGSRIVYLTIHKSGARDFAIQSRLHDLTVKMCGQWGVAVADAFTDTELDTRRAEDMRAYMIGGGGSHPNEECCEKFYIPTLAAKMISMLER